MMMPQMIGAEMSRILNGVFFFHSRRWRTIQTRAMRIIERPEMVTVKLRGGREGGREGGRKGRKGERTKLRAVGKHLGRKPEFETFERRRDGEMISASPTLAADS